MNLVQLRAFLAVVDNNSFSEAARVMGLSQPAVTMQVQGLESALGATLLDRRYRRIALTEAGHVLLPYARTVLTDIEAARSAIEALSDTVTGRLCLSGSTTPGEYVLPRLLGPFLREYPEVSVTMSVGATSEVVESVADGEAHIGVVGALVPGARVEFDEVGSDMIVVICAADHPFASRAGEIPLRELVEQPFILREVGSGTRRVAEEAFRTSGVELEDLQVVTELGTGEALVNAVEGGMGLAVVSRYVADKALRLGTVAEVTSEVFPLRRPFYVVTPRGPLTRAAAAFLEYLRTSL